MPLRESEIKMSGESPGPKRTESILTTEDRERITNLLRRGDQPLAMSEGEELGFEENLRQEGSKAAQFILEKIEKGVASTKWLTDPRILWNHIKWLELCASSYEAERLGKLLVSDDISLDRDRSNKIRVLNILGRVGTVENVQHLILFAEKLDNAPHYDNLSFVDIRIALATLRAIEARTTQDEEKRRIREGSRRLLAVMTHINIRQQHEREIEETRGQIQEDIYRVREESDPNWETGEDQLIEQQYKERRFREAEERLAVLKRLHHAVKKEKGIKEDPEDDDLPFLRRHWLEYREKNPPPFAPTLGIEIEIRYKEMLPKELWEQPKCEKNETSFEYNERLVKWHSERGRIIEEKKEKYWEIQEMGVPKGTDQFWEFAHRPARQYLTLSREVQSLIELGLIPKNNPKHSLHLTIGHITSTKGYDAFLLARALEASGWSTNGWRLLRPYLTKDMSWTVKAEGGINERYHHEIALGVDQAIEVRTLQLQSLAGLDRTLRSAYFLGAALHAHQRAPLKESAHEATREKLESLWKEFVQKCRGVFTKFGLPDPYYLWSQPDYTDESRDSEFTPLANLLNEARENQQSQGAEFVRTMRKLIIETRAKVAKVWREGP